MMNLPALLVLADGTVFKGVAIGALGATVGELVFNTAMTGYQEMLTDPSYARQMILLTTAHVGNTGCNLDDMESSKVWASGLIVRDAASVASNYRSDRTLPEWLKKHGVVAIAGIDTRALTQHIRTLGAINACITTDVADEAGALQLARACPSLAGLDLAQMVSRQMVERWHEGMGTWAADSLPKRFHVVVYDFGVKHSILRILYDKGCHVTIVPAKTSAADVLAMNPDGVVLSNGPGDPAACDYAIEATRTLLDTSIPLFGICLGFQILGLACGARALKMKFGHHGANHPVLDIERGRVLITSQNHGFALDEASLPSTLVATHRSLFDQTLQGVMHQNKPAFGFQGHPEAGPGPHDAECLFSQFIELMTQSVLTKEV